MELPDNLFCASSPDSDGGGVEGTLTSGMEVDLVLSLSESVREGVSGVVISIFLWNPNISENITAAAITTQAAMPAAK